MVIQQRAFTLAEVLITLGIIGVVAAITIPTLINNSQKKEAYSKLLKAYSAITNISTQIRSDNGSEMAGLATTDLEFANLFKPYMNVASFCQDETESPNCYISNSADIYNLQGGTFGSITPYPYSTNAKIVTTDGIVYMFSIESSNCSSTKYQRNGVGEFCGHVFLDINGAKSPNTFGKDLFVFSINKYNTNPYKRADVPDEMCVLPSNHAWNGSNCTYNAITEGGIKYY